MLVPRIDLRPRAPNGRAHTVVPSIPISCGNSHGGTFDGERARDLAASVFEIYGLAPERKQSTDSFGVRATLDGYDGSARVGFELRGLPSEAMMDAASRPEAPDDALDDNDSIALHYLGLRVHVADLNCYPLMDGDQFTPTLAYLAGLVEFLNDVTGGENVDLSAITMRRAQSFVLPAADELVLPEGVTARRDGLFLRVEVSRLATVRLDFLPIRACTNGELRNRLSEPAWLDEPRATRGAPTVVAMSAHYFEHSNGAGDGTSLGSRLLQPGVDGEPEVDVRVRGTILFAPSRFDATRAFSVELELSPGTHVFNDTTLIVGARGS
ncbi:MAG: hypothetical protein IPK60_20650 [Sandaracinaceae bacterium]|nr:hypothetical protein [Sandaracinaceae bacterium]